MLVKIQLPHLLILNNMKNKLETLATDCLNISQEPQNYDQEDLLNATLIFSHVFCDLAWQHSNKMKLSIRQKFLLAEEFGKNIRQTLLLATGIDMHQVMK